MATIQLDVQSSLSDDVISEITKRIYYCDSAIKRCDFNSENRTFVLNLESDDNILEIEAQVRSLVDKMSTGRLKVKPKVLRSRKRVDNKYDSNITANLTNNGFLIQEGFGTAARHGQLLELIRRLDKLFGKIGTEIYKAKEYDFNSLIPTDWLRRAGYFNAFAHSLTFTFHLQENYTTLEDFASRHNQGENLKLESLDEIAAPEHCLSPAICYHSYGLLKDSKFEKDDAGLKILTSSGRCFRYESRNITDLDRLWEFTMREIIFIGDKDKVLESRQDGIEKIWKLVEFFDMTASIVTAADPFFASDFQSLRFFQLANELKFELKLPIDENREFAAASFNYHENFFGNNFNIETFSGDRVHTGCLAFGLERFAFACLAQLGYEKTMTRISELENELTLLS